MKLSDENKQIINNLLAEGKTVPAISQIISVQCAVIYKYTYADVDKVKDKVKHVAKKTPRPKILSTDKYVDTGKVMPPIHKSSMTVIIDKNLGISGWSRAINLGGHIACTNYSKCSINRVPIILTDWNDLNLEDTSLKDPLINNVFQTTGIYFRKYEHLFSKKADSLTGEIKYLIDLEINRLKSIDFKKIEGNKSRLKYYFEHGIRLAVAIAPLTKLDP